MKTKYVKVENLTAKLQRIRSDLTGRKIFWQANAVKELDPAELNSSQFDALVKAKVLKIVKPLEKQGVDAYPVKSGEKSKSKKAGGDD